MMVRVVVVRRVRVAIIVVGVGHAPMGRAVRRFVIPTIRESLGHHSSNDQSTIPADASEVVATPVKPQSQRWRSDGKSGSCFSEPACLWPASRLLATTSGLYVEGRTRESTVTGYEMRNENEQQMAQAEPRASVVPFAALVERTTHGSLELIDVFQQVISNHWLGSMLRPRQICAASTVQKMSRSSSNAWFSVT